MLVLRECHGNELDPLVAVTGADYGLLLLMAHKYDQAIEQCNKNLDVHPDFPLTYRYLGYLYAQKGMFEEAIDASEKAVTLSGRNPVYLAALGYALAAAGRRVEAQKILDELNKLANDELSSPYQIALIHARLGEKEKSSRRRSCSHPKGVGAARSDGT